MLLQFSVSNFRSLKEEQFLTMVPSKIKGHEENIAHVGAGQGVLRSAVIYGANASGKSNFIKALKTLTQIIKKSADTKPNEPIEGYEPFRLSSDFNKGPVGFSVDFLIGNIRYNYSFSYLPQYFLSEKLSFFPQGREARLYERKGQEFSFGEYFKGPKKLLEQITAPNQLLLSKGANNNVEEPVKIFTFFQSIYSIANYSDAAVNILAKTTANFSKNGVSSYKNYLKHLFTLLDTGIIDFKIEETNPGLKNQIKSDDFKTVDFKIKTIHKVIEDDVTTEIAFDLEDESAGTQKLFGLSGLIIDVLDKGWVLIMDELERSLHPHISRFILSLFNNPKINKNNAQLIAATHDATLLSEENNLRRDQIWIVEKNENGASELFSLADMKGIRDNVPFEKWYLSGRFGGVPNIESLQFEFDYLDEKKKNISPN